MELDKIAYITLACLTGLIIILVIAFGTYGSNISKDPSFIMFFKWYIFLFVFNLFNILVTLIFHYIMADIPGEKGLKGFTGDRGLPGESSKCFCVDGIKLSNQKIKDIDLNKNIHTRDVMGPNKINRIGTVIYDGEKDEALTVDHKTQLENKIAEIQEQREEDQKIYEEAKKKEARDKIYDGLGGIGNKYIVKCDDSTPGWHHLHEYSLKDDKYHHITNPAKVIKLEAEGYKKMVNETRDRPILCHSFFKKGDPLH